MDIQKEREAFESWIKKEYPEMLELISHSDIKQAYDFSWEVWQAAKAQAVPEGFVLVPKEPTEAMYIAGIDKRQSGGNTADVYKAMIEAQEPK